METIIQHCLISAPSSDAERAIGKVNVRDEGDTTDQQPLSPVGQPYIPDIAPVHNNGPQITPMPEPQL